MLHNDDTTVKILELMAELAGVAGPYILSDLRFGAGPLYVRYGAFHELYCFDSDGDAVTASLQLEAPGQLVTSATEFAPALAQRQA